MAYLIGTLLASGVAGAATLLGLDRDRAFYPTVVAVVAAFFLVSGLFAPNRSARISLLAATTIETAVFAYVALSWFHPFRHP